MRIDRGQYKGIRAMIPAYVLTVVILGVSVTAGLGICTAYADPASTYNEGGSEGPAAESGERYNTATTTNPFLMPGNTWVTPVATYGQDVIVVLPVVNMFKYNISDVIITPRLGAKTEDFPFEINNTGYTQKIGTLVGEDAQPNYSSRIYNCAWMFRTRENVKTGYYKLDFDITYTDPTCAVDTTVISVYVKTVGLPENGTTDGIDPDKKISTPRLIVKGFTTSPEEIFSEYYIIRVNEFNQVARTPLEEWLDYLKSGHIKENTTTPGLAEAKEKLQYLRMTLSTIWAATVFNDHFNAWYMERTP